MGKWYLTLQSFCIGFSTYWTVDWFIEQPERAWIAVLSLVYWVGTAAFNVSGMISGRYE